MTRRLSAAALSLLLFCPPSADAETLSGRELRKALKQAGRAWEVGDAARATELYEQVLASTEPGDGDRPDALYALAMARLSPEGPARDAEAARGDLEELTASFPLHPRRLETAAVLQLLGEIDAFAAEAERRDSEVEEIEAERQAIADASEAAGGQVKSLEEKLRKTRAELSRTRSKLEKTEGELQQLKDALLNRAGGG